MPYIPWHDEQIEMKVALPFAASPASAGALAESSRKRAAARTLKRKSN